MLDIFIDGFLGFLGFSLNKPDIFPPRASQQNQTEIPTEVQSQDQDVAKKASEDLGNNTGIGIYNKDIAPQAQANLKESCRFEQLYEGANFPNGIIPITSSSGSGCQK